jgi:predicted transcriptional regulator
MDKHADRFLTAYNDIDKWLRKILRTNNKVSFWTLLEDASNSKNVSPQYANVVGYYKDDLKEFADLRNAIVHEHRNDEVIATPHLKAVLGLEAIRRRLLDPPRVYPLFERDVMQCVLDDPIGTVAQQMRDRKFSQVPVYSGARLLALLTTDTIARWVAWSLPKDKGIMEEAPVKDVLNQAEFTDNYRLLDPAATVIDALDCFDDYFRRGRRLDAILIIKDEKKTNTPVGIINVSDIPKLYASLE